MTSIQSTLLDGLRTQAQTTVTPDWLDKNLEVRTFNSMHRATVASVADGALSICLALVVDDDVPSDYEPGFYVGLVCELIGPYSQLLDRHSVWGIKEDATFDSAEYEAYLSDLSFLASDLISECCIVDYVRKSLQQRADTINETLALLF